MNEVPDYIARETDQTLEEWLRTLVEICLRETREPSRTLSVWYSDALHLAVSISNELRRRYRDDLLQTFGMAAAGKLKHPQMSQNRARFSSPRKFFQAYRDAHPDFESPLRPGPLAVRTASRDPVRGGHPRALVPDIDATGVRFLMIKLDLAITLMEIAGTYKEQEGINRNHRNARKAYETVLSFMPRLRLTVDETDTLTRKLVWLRAILQKVGHAF